MGCGASSEPEHSHSKQRPQAAVKPYPTAQPQQPRLTVKYDPKKTEIAVKPIATTKDLLQKYMDLDNQIRTLEASSGMTKHSAMQQELQATQESVPALNAKWEECKAKVNKEKGEYEDMFKVWSSTADAAVEGEETNTDLMREKNEWLDAVGEMDVARKALDDTKAKIAGLEAKLKSATPNNDVLQQKYKEQDELLAAIFNGKYGSDAENKLEAEYDFTADKLQRVKAARYKWTNGRNLLNHATAQLCNGCKKWMSLNQMQPNDQHGRFQAATEARNNFIAAAQNITSAKKYLSTIDFPYCKPDEVAVMEKAAAHCYTDMNTKQRHSYVYANVYHSMYRRCKALVDWFTHVLTSTIVVDLKEAESLTKSQATELRQERLNLISQKIKEELQQEVQFEARAPEVPEDTTDIEEDNSQAFKAEEGKEEQQTDEEPPAGEVEAEVPFNPVPLKELVQAPNKEDLFGDAQELYRKHQEDLEELEKNQMINKARQEQGLEEKLKARRSKRQRQAALAAELEVQQPDAAEA